MSMKNYYVYEIVNPITNRPFYIGWTSRSGELRFKEHIRETRNKVVNIDKVNIIKDILNQGAEPVFNIVFQTSDKGLSVKKETELIEYHGRIKDGGILTNISKGGEHHIVSDDTKKRLSKKRKNKSYIELYGEERASKIKKNLSEKSKGANNNMFGKNHSDEAKRKMSEKLKGRPNHPVGDYQKERIRESNKSRVWTDEMRKKMSESQKQRYKERPDTFVKPEWKPESRLKIGVATKSRATQYTFYHAEHGNFYGTTGDLARAYNFSRPSEAYKLVKGEYKSYKGWKLG